MKQREYDLEDRDIVILPIKELTLNKDVLVDKLNKNLSIYFPYTFLRLNCAYYIGELIQDISNIDFNWRLINRPIDVVRQVTPHSQDIFTIASSWSTFNHYKRIFPGVLEFENAFDATTEKTINADPILMSASSAYVQYMLPRETDNYKRQQLARVQKSVWHKDVSFDSEPIIYEQESSVALAINTRGHSFVEYRPFSSSFASNSYDQPQGNYLQAGRIVIARVDDRLLLHEFNALKIEASQQGLWKSRYIDLSYVGWDSPGKPRESFARLGVGGAVLGDSYLLSAIPFMGVRYSSSQRRNEWRTEFGVRVTAEKAWNEILATRIVLQTRQAQNPLPRNSVAIENRIKLTKSRNFMYTMNKCTYCDLMHEFAFVQAF